MGVVLDKLAELFTELFQILEKARNNDIDVDEWKSCKRFVLRNIVAMEYLLTKESYDKPEIETRGSRWNLEQH